MKKIKKKPTVTIGIPAYSEEANIGNLIKSLLKQKHDNFILEKIIVVSDGSTDGTVPDVKEIKSKLIKLVASNARKGKSLRLNQLAKMNKSDYLFFIDADSLVEENAISQIVKKFASNKRLGLIAGNQFPVKNKGAIENALSTREEILGKIKRWKNGENVYAFRGGFLGVKKKLTEIIDIPNTSGNDAYLYFFAKMNAYKVGYCESAVAKFRLPESLNDHLRQSHRFVDSRKKMEEYFGNDISAEYKLPRKFLFGVVLKVGKMRPVGLLLYLLVYLYSTLLSFFRKPTIDGTWEISTSTKKAINN